VFIPFGHDSAPLAGKTRLHPSPYRRFMRTLSTYFPYSKQQEPKTEESTKGVLKA
jgi:hypothetical protein